MWNQYEDDTVEWDAANDQMPKVLKMFCALV
jgi:hypothetical protein